MHRALFKVTAPAHWEVVSNGAPADADAAGDAKTHHLRDDAADEHLPRRADRRAVRRVARRLHRRARRDPARALLPRVAGRVHGRRASCSPRPSRASTSTTASSASRTRSASTTSCSCRSSTPARWRTPARVTFREDYVFRSQGHPRVLRAARRDRAARDGAHVVRRPGHHAVVGRPVAQRVVRRRAHRCCARPRPPSTPTAWTTFANAEKSWAYRQDQLPSTHPVAADIPDLARRRGQLRRHHLRQGRLACSSSWSPTSASRRSSPGCATTSATTPSATPRFGDLLGALEKSSGRDLSRLGPSSGCKTTGLNTLRADFDVDADGDVHPLRHRAERRRARRRRAARAPAGRRHLRRRRLRQAGARAPRGARRRGRAHRGSRAASACRAAELMLVNDDDLTYCPLRLDPESLATRARPASPTSPTRSPARWLVGGVGDDPRGRAEGPRLRGARRSAGVGAETEVGVASGCCCRRRPRCAPTPTRTGPAPRAGRRSPTGCWSWPAPPSPDRTTSWPTSTRCARRCSRCATSPCWPRCWTPIPPSTDWPGWSSTPTCGGASSPRWPPRATSTTTGRQRRSSTPRPSAIRPPRASATRRARRRPVRRLAVKDTAWQQVIEDDTLPNIVGRAIIDGFVQPGQQALLQPFTAKYFDAIPRCVGAAVQRGRADGRHRPVPVVGHQPGRRWTPPTGSWPATCRRRCGGWCSRAAQASSARCGPGPSTSARSGRGDAGAHHARRR